MADDLHLLFPRDCAMDFDSGSCCWKEANSDSMFEIVSLTCFCCSCYYVVVAVAVVQSPCHLRLFVTPWTAAHQASLSLTISQSLSKFIFMASVIPSSHLILWCHLLLLCSIFLSIWDFSSELSVCIRWARYQSFSISPSNTLATWCEELTRLKTLWCWERLKAGGEGDDRGWDGGIASPTQRTWVWVNSQSWWWTGKPGVLQSTGLQRVRHNWVTELSWTCEQKRLAHPCQRLGASLLALMQFACNAGDTGNAGSIFGSKDPLEESMRTRSSIPAWIIPWAEEPGWLQFMGSQKARHNWNNCTDIPKTGRSLGDVLLCWRPFHSTSSLPLTLYSAFWV